MRGAKHIETATRLGGEYLAEVVERLAEEPNAEAIRDALAMLASKLADSLTYRTNCQAALMAPAAHVCFSIEEEA